MNYLKEIKTVIEKDIVLNKKLNYYKNESLVKTYFEIGRLLVEAQGGLNRSKYGDNLIKNWSIELTSLYGKGYNLSNLKRMRQFYIVFQKGAPVGHQLTWTNLKYLLPIKDENKRNYYINMCIKQYLSKGELSTMIKSNAYERLSYADKNHIEVITNDRDIIPIKDTLKDPIIIVLDKNVDNLDERTIKEIIIEKLEKLFIELGAGYTFVGSEYKLGQHRCDLLLFNVEQLCYVVIELKKTKLVPKDIGQIEYYMNYIDSNIKKEIFNNTIGIILTKEGNKIIMKYCSNPNIYSITYKLTTK